MLGPSGLEKARERGMSAGEGEARRGRGTARYGEGDDDNDVTSG